MGSETGDRDERPRHAVYIAAFLIDRFEVTNAQYAAFLNHIRRNVDSEGHSLIDLNISTAQILQVGDSYELKSSTDADRPVWGVTWYGAAAYAQWVGGRLPTEAEWEKAARGSDVRDYPWGSERPRPDLANFGTNHDGNTVVGAYERGASPYGILDLAGNVREWVYDWYDPEYYLKTDRVNPSGPRTGMERVQRGGAWPADAWRVRVTDREGMDPATGNDCGGFRIVLDVGSRDFVRSERMTRDD